MELAHSLLLNEEALAKIPDNKKPVFIFEWLRFLDKVLFAAQKSDIKESQQKLIAQLSNEMTRGRGPPTRKLIASCLATIFSVGDTSALFDMLNKCNDVLKNKDDSPAYLLTKLAAVTCIGEMHERLGRMVGRSYEETISLLLKLLKNADSQLKCEILIALRKMVIGLGSAANSSHKDIYKAAKNLLTDRCPSVKCAAATCLCELVNECSWLHASSEVESLANVSFRGMDGTSYEARCHLAHLLGCLLSAAVSANPKTMPAKNKLVKLEDALSFLGAGMMRGASGFLKGAENKNNGNINRDVRVGVTYAYVEFTKKMGSKWLERNLSTICNHLFSVVSSARITAYHIDTVHARKCCNFILRKLIGEMLGEKAQIAAAKELCATVAKHMAVIENMADTTNGVDESLLQNQHIIVVALQEVSSLLLVLATSATPLISDPSSSIIEPVSSVLLHPMLAPRLSAAWCLRSIAVAMPSQMTILIDRFINRMNHLKSSPEAISGYSGALSALLGGVRETKLGIPHSKGKQIFLLGEELIRTASQNSRLSLQRATSGWVLLSAFMCLGSAVVRPHLPRMLHLWKTSFPRSHKEMEGEKVKRDCFSWQVSLESRAGALASMQSFVTFCEDLVTGEVSKRMVPPLESALSLISILPGVVKVHGGQLKGPAVVVRLRLYNVLSLLRADFFEGSFSTLLRELIGEFTLNENPGNTCTSFLGSLCHLDESVVMSKFLKDTDHKALEDQLQMVNSTSGSGSLEHDSTYLYLASSSQGSEGPLPLGVSVIDASIRLFGKVFPKVTNKHRLQMFDHFLECIKQNKSTRQQAVQVNVFTAVLCSLKCLAESKTGFGSAEVRKVAMSLVESVLQSSNPMLRCAAGEAMGRMVQVANDIKFLAEMAQCSFDKLKTARDVVTRTGHSLALGCLHRYKGGMGASQHIHTSVSILLALAQDHTSSTVQVWSLHSLALIADSGGPLFRSFVEPSLSLVLQLLLAIPSSQVDVFQCLGRCLSALITIIGPDLHDTNSTSVSTARLYCLVCCGVMQDHTDSSIQALAVSCLQQLHLFTPRHVNLGTLVPRLCENLSSKHIQLRRATVACLRQLVQKEASEVAEHSKHLTTEAPRTANNRPKQKEENEVDVSEAGLEASLFAVLDRSYDVELSNNAKDTIISLLQALVEGDLQGWLALIKRVLHSSAEGTSSTEVHSSTKLSGADERLNEEEGDEDEEMKIQSGETDANEEVFRWPTRVFAMQCLAKVIRACEGNETHFDLAAAKCNVVKDQGDYLVLHLPELVRMSFIAATSDSDKLRLAGLNVLQEIIRRFSKVPEPEFPGHVILEQYQAQVGAALRPAFSPETAPDVTAAACEVCSRWIGSGVARDLNGLRRVHQLLVSSLTKLNDSKDPCLLYSESALTMEKLAVLKAWAEVYIVTMEQEEEKKLVSTVKKSSGCEDDDDFGEFSGGAEGEESLLCLVQNEIATLSEHWIALLKDYAFLSLPPEYHNQLPVEGGTFYSHDTLDTARPHYKTAWPSALYALCLWSRQVGFKNLRELHDVESSESALNHRLFLILGVCTEAMCNPTSVHSLQTVTMCLKSLHLLLLDPWCLTQLHKKLSVELLNILHRLLLTRDSTECFQLIISVVKQLVDINCPCIQDGTKMSEGEVEGEKEEKEEEEGEGGDDGEITPGESVSFAALEVCLCVLVRHIPSLNPAILSSSSSSSSVFKPSTFNQATINLLTTTVHILPLLPSLCSPKGCLSILPSLLFLTVGIIKEIDNQDRSANVSVLLGAALQAFKAFCVHPTSAREEVKKGWMLLLQSALLSLVSEHKSDASGDHVTGSEEGRVAGLKGDKLLLTVTIFLISCPPHTVTHPDIFTPSISILSDYWSKGSFEIKLKVVQSLVSICQKCQSEVAQAIVKVISPKILHYVIEADKEDLSQVPLLVEAARLLECLVLMSHQSQHEKLLQIVVPLLISMLNKNDKLHQVALQKLIDVATQFRGPFHALMQHNSHYRGVLEGAIKQSTNNHSSKTNLQARSLPETASQSQEPTIKLKMDFSNFNK